MRDLSIAKYGNDGRARPFGGLNVILAGDLYQLPPPKGTFLGDIPWDLVAGRKATKQATALHGQTLLWGGPDAGMQGVTELRRCERTADAWLTEVQTELRHGQLSDNNHAFLHGAPTTVPGSWTAGRVTCKSQQCASLGTGQVPAHEIQQQECGVCAQDRATRALVVHAKPDARCQEALENAVAIFGTNDIKYHVNKRRAMLWATSRGKTVYVAVARDKASATVLQEKSDLMAEKLQWLQRHDKECGGLYGLLPLCVGMPVRATEHLDRRRGILKGCRGTIVGWSSCAGETQDGVVLWNTLPQAVYVKFETAEGWQIEGVPENNVYPVATCTRAWFLDRQRKNPQLRVSRTQFPLAPAFAITAHVAQGQTIPEGVLTDLCVGLGGNPFTAYVAFTRVQGRAQLFIYRAFDAAPLQKGIGLGRDLLLRQLRGERIDWKALLAKYCEERTCGACAERKPANAFTAGQWKRSDADRVCRECAKRYADAGTPWQCSVCKRWYAETNFPDKHRQRQCSLYRVCLTCETKKPCARCGLAKSEADFGAAAWKARHAERRCCRTCAAKMRDHWTCSHCAERKPRAEFSAWQEKRTWAQDGTQCCNTCVSLTLVCRVATRANQRVLPLRRRIQREREQAIIEEVRREIAAVTEQRWKTNAKSTPCAMGLPNMARKVAVAADTGNVPARLASGAGATHESHPQCGPEKNKDKNNNTFDYTCPFCAAAVHSSVRSGQVNHRKHCGNQFRVKDGCVVAQKMVYRCPFCDGTVRSNVMTGRIDHRSVCGSQFWVKTGKVTDATRRHSHTCPQCRTVVWSARASGRIRVQHTTPSGRPCSQKSWESEEKKEA